MRRSERKAALRHRGGLTAVPERKEGVSGGQGLGDGDVQAGCSDLPRGQGLIQVLLVHHAAPDNGGKTNGEESAPLTPDNVHLCLRADSSTGWC